MWTVVLKTRASARMMPDGRRHQARTEEGLVYEEAMEDAATGAEAVVTMLFGIDCLLEMR